jgi:hypothetical protein
MKGDSNDGYLHMSGDMELEEMSAGITGWKFLWYLGVGWGVKVCGIQTGGAVVNMFDAMSGLVAVLMSTVVM